MGDGLRTVLERNLVEVSHLAMPDSSKAQPLGRFADFFTGPVRAEGVFRGPLNTTQRAFSVRGTGKPTDNGFILDETINFDDGAREDRVWRMEATSDGTVTGTAEDVRRARGHVAGRVLTMKYVYEVPVRGRHIALSVTDVMTLRDDQTLTIEGTFKKFGLTIGRLHATFTRLSATEHGGEEALAA